MMTGKNGIDAMAEAQGRRAVDEFRCVRPGQYPKGTAWSKMQGHYVLARNQDHARERMAEFFPDDDKASFGIEYWKSYDTDGNVEYYGVLQQ